MSSIFACIRVKYRKVCRVRIGTILYRSCLILSVAKGERDFPEKVPVTGVWLSASDDALAYEGSSQGTVRMARRIAVSGVAGKKGLEMAGKVLSGRFVPNQASRKGRNPIREGRVRKILYRYGLHTGTAIHAMSRHHRFRTVHSGPDGADRLAVFPVGRIRSPAGNR